MICIVTTCVDPEEWLNARQDLEDVEGRVFDKVDDVDRHFAPMEVRTYTLSEFVDAANNEEVDLYHLWITHVEIR